MCVCESECVCVCVHPQLHVCYIASLAEILDPIVLNPKLKKNMSRQFVPVVCVCVCVCVCYPDCNSNLRGFLFMRVGTVSGAPGGAVRSAPFFSHIIKPSHYGT